MMDVHQELKLGFLLHNTHSNQDIWIKVHKRRKQNLRKSLPGYLIWTIGYLNGDGRGKGGSWSSLYLSGIILSVILAVCSAGPMIGCPAPDYIEHQNGYCCRVTSCPANYSVTMCVDDYSNDTCVPCPEGGFLLDPTTSETITRCVVPTCSKNVTKPSPVKSTVVNPHACPMWCQCDLDFGYCGTDPCRCTKKKCGYGSVLQQDCGCQPITPSPPKPTTPKVIPVTVSSKSISSSPPGNTTTEAALPSHHTTAPGIIPSTVSSNTKSPADTGLSDEAIAGIVSAVVIIIIIGIIVWQCRKNRKKRKEVKTKPEAQNGHVTYTYNKIYVNGVELVHVGDSHHSRIEQHLSEDDASQSLLHSPSNTIIEHSSLPNGISSESVDEDCAAGTEEAGVANRPGSSGRDGSGDETQGKSVVTGDETQVKIVVTGDETQVKSVVTGYETQVKSVVTGDETQVKIVVTGDETQVKSVVNGDKTQVKSVVTGDETKAKSSREMKRSKGEKQAKIANGGPRNETHEQAQQNGNSLDTNFKGFI